MYVVQNCRHTPPESHKMQKTRGWEVVAVLTKACVASREGKQLYTQKAHSIIPWILTPIFTDSAATAGPQYTDRLLFVRRR